jgi:hypothetical protein
VVQQKALNHSPISQSFGAWGRFAGVRESRLWVRARALYIAAPSETRY